MIADEGADMVIHSGDFDYGDNPTVWDDNITNVLGPSFPYFASVGNHDLAAWSGYQQKLQDRLNLISGAVCTGDLGVKSSCHYQGLFFILSGVGTLGSGHVAYIQDQLSQDDSVWSICSWHKNQNAMQVGSKGNEVGWGAYEECRKGGAIIATGHEHSYERTKTLISTQNQIVDPAWTNPGEVRVAEGSTFVFVSGLGGQGIRNQDRCTPTAPPYGCSGEWASIYTNDQGANHGALFCTFNVAGQADKASCYFKDISNNVPDSFSVTSFMGTPQPNNPPTADAGTDQNVNENVSVTLDGTGSFDSDGTITSYEWIEGATLGFGASLNHDFAVGTHVVTLEITDDDGATDTDTVTITVNAPQAKSLTITNPHEGSIVTGKITIIMSVTGFSTNPTVDLYIDDGLPETSISSPPYEYQLHTKTLSADFHVIKAVIASENLEDSVTVEKEAKGNGSRGSDPGGSCPPGKAKKNLC